MGEYVFTGGEYHIFITLIVTVMITMIPKTITSCVSNLICLTSRSLTSNKVIYFVYKSILVNYNIAEEKIIPNNNQQHQHSKLS